LALVQQVHDLQLRADRDLWPATVDRVLAMRSWIDAAEALRPTQERLLARRDRLATATVAGDPLTAARHAWRVRALTEAVAVGSAFFTAAPPTPSLPLVDTVAAVRRRLEHTRALHARTIDAEAADAAWRAATARVRADPRFAGLALPPQPGLLPIGPDPVTGLEEFVHVASGEPPPRSTARHLQADAGSGIVLVLVPGGTFAMGAAANTDAADNHDPLAEAINEGPVHAVTLAPFLIGKFELTQAQWLRLTGRSPSVHGAVSIHVGDDEAPLHPVESIDWFTARDTLRKHGLVLPTEAQWEYAARAGTKTPWWCGERIEDLLQPPAGNLADATSAAAPGVQGWMPTPGLHDGFVMHAPVGRFAANAFGLHDVLGNVHEWCDDEYAAYHHPTAPGDGGRRRSERPQTAIYRGGAFDQPAAEARSANRAGGPPDRRHFALGMRAVRRLVR
jgi:formylglycine-generating enzyme required for sulfatase activity